MVINALTLAQTNLQPGNAIAWIILGFLAGLIADKLIPGKGFGCLGNTIIGVVGAFVGGFLVNILVPNQTYGFWGSLLVALLGASLLFVIIGMARGDRRR